MELCPKSIFENKQLIMETKQKAKSGCGLKCFVLAERCTLLPGFGGMIYFKYKTRSFSARANLIIRILDINWF